MRLTLIIIQNYSDYIIIFLSKFPIIIFLIMNNRVSNVHDTHYLVGSAIGPHPFPTMVRTFQSVIGREVLAEMKRRTGKGPDMVVACVSGGSNAIGLFHPFIDIRRADGSPVRMVGVQAGGEGIAD